MMTNETTPEKVSRIIQELFTELLKTSGAVDESAKKFWEGWYTDKFVRAIDERHLDYDACKRMLLGKAAVLAAAARRRAAAGPITARHAEDASREVDCKRPSGLTEPVQTQDYWCY